jgi:hypothetical protein
MIKMVQQLPASASAVEAMLPNLSYLDSRAAAALLKGLAKAGLGQRAVDIFDYLRWVAITGSPHLDDSAALAPFTQPMQQPCKKLQLMQSLACAKRQRVALSCWCHAFVCTAAGCVFTSIFCVRQAATDNQGVAPGTCC